MIWAPFVIYADLKSILMPVDKRRNSTHLYDNHKPCVASALLCSTVPAYNNQFYLFTNEDALSQLLDQLIKWETELLEQLKQNCKMRLFFVNSIWRTTIHWYDAFVTTKTVHLTIPSITTAKSRITITSQAIISKPRMTSATGNAAWSLTFPYFSTTFADTIHIWWSPRFPAPVTELAKLRWSTKTWNAICSSSETKTSFFVTRLCFSQTPSSRYYIRYAKQTKHILSTLSLWWVCKIQMPISNYFFEKVSFCTSTSIRSRNSTSPHCQIARHF